jgi:hypothetical protein
MATRQSSAGGPVHCHLQIARQRDLGGIFRAALDAESRHTGVRLNILLGDRGIGFFVLDPTAALDLSQRLVDVAAAIQRRRP